MSDVDAEKVLKQITQRREEEEERQAKEKRYQELKAINEQEKRDRESAEREQRAADKAAVAEEQKRAAEESKRRKKIEQVEKNIEAARIRQEDSEKAKEFKEIAAKGAKKTPYVERRQITPATIKESVRKAVSKAPAAADRAITGTFGGMAQSFIAPQKTSFKKAYTSETKELSATAKQFVKSQQAPSKKKTYVTPKVRPGGLAINHAFVDNLIGISGPSKTQPAPKKSLSNVTSSLDRFARLI